MDHGASSGHRSFPYGHCAEGPSKAIRIFEGSFGFLRAFEEKLVKGSKELLMGSLEAFIRI